VQVRLDGNTIIYLQSQAVVQAGQATLNLSFLTLSKYFNQQGLWADGMLIPHLHKALNVRRKVNPYL
jgi:hypothetical protein